MSLTKISNRQNIEQELHPSLLIDRRVAQVVPQKFGKEADAYAVR